MTKYNTKDLINSISFDEDSKSFKEQLLNDESFKILAGLYGKYPKLREIIEKQLEKFFIEFPEAYFKTALSTLKVGGLVLDVIHNGKVTISP